jgi:ribonuclease-3
MPRSRRTWLSTALTKLFRGKSEFVKLENNIGHHFRDTSILREALAHRSYVKTAAAPVSPSFERLEFLGDSILGMLVAEELFMLYPDYSEGRLTKLKAALVNEMTLASIAKNLGIGEFIMLSDEEAKAGGRERPSITSDCFEAVLAAIYMDGGICAARHFVKQHVISRITEVRNDKSIKNYKGDLLELTQGEAAGTPRYDVVEESGPDHNKTFTVTVHGFGVELAVGKGHSKKEAEQEAARKALPAAYRYAGNGCSKPTDQED